MRKTNLILLFLISFSCTSDLSFINNNNKNTTKSPSSTIEPTSTPMVLPTFSIPPNFNLDNQNFLKKNEYINYLKCALENSKDDKEKENIQKSINIVSNVSNEITFKPNNEYLKYCSHLITKVTNNPNEKILTKSQYINYLNCSLEKSKNDVQKEAIKRNIETVKNSPDNFKFNANIEFLEECSNSF